MARQKRTFCSTHVLSRIWVLGFSERLLWVGKRVCCGEQAQLLPGPGSGVDLVRADVTQYMGLPEALDGRCDAAFRVPNI